MYVQFYRYVVMCQVPNLWFKLVSTFSLLPHNDKCSERSHVLTIPLILAPAPL